MSRETDNLQGTIDDLASKVIFFFAFFAIIDQFWCQIINCLMGNITFATQGMKTWCFEAKEKLWKKSTLCCVRVIQGGQKFLGSLTLRRTFSSTTHLAGVDQHQGSVRENVAALIYRIMRAQLTPSEDERKIFPQLRWMEPKHIVFKETYSNLNQRFLSFRL